MVSPLGLITISGSRVKRPTKITRFTMLDRSPFQTRFDEPAKTDDSLPTTSLGPRMQKRERIDRHTCDAHLEVQVRSGTVAGRSQQGDRLSRGNDVARLHERPIEMPVQRAEPWIVRQQNVEAVAAAL